MNSSRRDFLKNAAILSGAAGISNMLPFSIQKAAAINAEPGTTFYDAEHIVFLMQENRSFDHLFGKMKGVRGFNDPRAKTLPDGNKVWVQKDKKGNAFIPFHIDINKTKITWQGGLPHGWKDQSAARNHGKYDKWIPNKTTMTMGHYDRSDVPFYYNLAEAFTICDHNFCSSLTGTTPNRLFFWTGNIRPDLTGLSVAAVDNSQAESRDNTYVDWSSFPELLEEAGVSWRVYQNELWTSHIKDDDVDYWLGNYGDNALEYIKRNHVRLSAYFRKNGDASGPEKLSAEEVTKRYLALSEKQKNLVDKCFTTNIDEADDYLQLAPFSFKNDKGEEQTVRVPKGDIFQKFRHDVDNNQLPTVSWLVAPQSFSDHTSTPFYGTWYVSEALDILTKNPEVWQKTIFILNYDENDGYFDHLPPFVAPNPKDPDTGSVTKGIDCNADFEFKANSPIGLGYRVPMIVASPWSKGGYVNSEIFDHTSTLQFLEDFLKRKTGKQIYSPHISSWRRAICGNLSSVFRPYNGEKIPLPDFENRDEVISNIQNAKNKPAQAIPVPLTEDQIKLVNDHHSFSDKLTGLFDAQEKGTKPANALPYQLSADGHVDSENKWLSLKFTAVKTQLANQIQTVGTAFTAYTPDSYLNEKGKSWSFAVEAGESLIQNFDINKFDKGIYNLCIQGPNGFFRQLSGSVADPSLKAVADYQRKGFFSGRLTGNLMLCFQNTADEELDLLLNDNAYGSSSQSLHITSKSSRQIIINLEKNSGWYDFSIRIKGNDSYLRRYAGHVETGNISITDPFMGGVI